MFVKKDNRSPFHKALFSLCEAARPSFKLVSSPAAIEALTTLFQQPKPPPLFRPLPPPHLFWSHPFSTQSNGPLIILRYEASSKTPHWFTVPPLFTPVLPLFGPSFPPQPFPFPSSSSRLSCVPFFTLGHREFPNLRSGRVLLPSASPQTRRRSSPFVFFRFTHIFSPPSKVLHDSPFSCPGAAVDGQVTLLYSCRVCIAPSFVLFHFPSLMLRAP